MSPRLLPLGRPVLALALLTASFMAAADPAPYADFRATCQQNNEEMRKVISDAPAASDPTRKLMELMFDPGICACMDTGQARLVTIDSPDPELRYIAANSSCTSSVVAEEFPKRCPQIYGDLLPLLGHHQPTPETLADVCSCAAPAMAEALTPQALLQTQLEQLRHFKLLVEDRRNGTNKVSRDPPEPGAFDRAILGLRHCAIDRLGDLRAPRP